MAHGLSPPCWPSGSGVLFESGRSGGSIPACAMGIVSGPVIPSDLNIGTPVDTLPGVSPYRASAGTG